MLYVRPWVALVGALCWTLVACGSGGDGPLDGMEVERSSVQRELSPAVTPTDQANVVEGAGDFSLALYQELAEASGSENLFFSPFSLSLALSMTWAGAEGQTGAEMADTLGFDLPPERHHAAVNWLDLALESRGQGASGTDSAPFRLALTNALFGQQGHPFHAAFLDRIALNYGAGMNLVDFMGASEAARLTINAWVAQQTEDMIPQLLSPGDLGLYTTLVLVNTIYFNAAWASQFSEYRTRTEPFHRLDGSTVDVDMMHQSARFPYVATDGVQLVELPYDGDEVSMVVLLPDAGRFAEIESSLDGATLRQLLGLLQGKQVNLGLPRFQVDSSFQLADTLAGMGMPTPFNAESADFSGMSDGQLFISAVVHQAVVEVDEEGTEAAAATAVVMDIDGGMPPPQETIDLTIDRPYIFLIRDRATGAILFLGRVLDPS